MGHDLWDTRYIEFPFLHTVEGRNIYCCDPGLHFNPHLFVAFVCHPAGCWLEEGEEVGAELR